MSAMGGRARKKLITGSAKARTPRYQPSRKPTGTAQAVPSDTPTRTRLVEAHTSRSKFSLTSSSPNFAATSCGAGTSPGFTRPLARTAYHSATMTSQGASTRAPLLSLRVVKPIFLLSWCWSTLVGHRSAHVEVVPAKVFGHTGIRRAGVRLHAFDAGDARGNWRQYLAGVAGRALPRQRL